jgi:hypothetical protein
MRAAMFGQREPLLTHPPFRLGDLILNYHKRSPVWIYGTPKLHQIRVGFEHLVVRGCQCFASQAEHMIDYKIGPMLSGIPHRA